MKLLVEEIKKERKALQRVMKGQYMKIDEKVKAIESLGNQLKKDEALLKEYDEFIDMYEDPFEEG